VHLCAVEYGYGVAADLARYEPEFRLREFAELAGILRA
jgi:hypothetical protein